MAPATSPLIRSLQLGAVGPSVLADSLLKPKTLDYESPSQLPSEGRALAEQYRFVEEEETDAWTDGAEDEHGGATSTQRSTPPAELPAQDSSLPRTVVWRRAFRRFELRYLKPIFGGRNCVPSEPNRRSHRRTGAVQMLLSPWDSWDRTHEAMDSDASRRW